MIPPELKEQLSQYGTLLATIRHGRETPAQRRELGDFLGKFSKAAWANMTDEERSAEMRERAETREENRRRVAAGLPKLPPKSKRGP